MKEILSLLVLVMLHAGVWAQVQIPLDKEGSVRFKIRNFGFNVHGSFSGLLGKIRFDPASMAGASFDVSVDAASVNTGNETRDNHLRKEEYFDVKKFPRIRFVSTRVTKAAKAGTLFVFGRLTIRNVTKEISFPFIARTIKEGYSFSGEFKINRRHFGVGGNSMISDELVVYLDVYTRKE
jgi:polyisoprenoid-binding protein YceI